MWKTYGVENGRGSIIDHMVDPLFLVLLFILLGRRVFEMDVSVRIAAPRKTHLVRFVVVSKRHQSLKVKEGADAFVIEREHLMRSYGQRRWA